MRRWVEVLIMDWIKCSEMMPDNFDMIIFCAHNKFVSCGRYCGIKNGHKTWESDEYVYWDDEVSHWMPLPDPPKEATDNVD